MPRLTDPTGRTFAPAPARPAAGASARLRPLVVLASLALAACVAPTQGAGALPSAIDLPVYPTAPSPSVTPSMPGTDPSAEPSPGSTETAAPTDPATTAAPAATPSPTDRVVRPPVIDLDDDDDDDDDKDDDDRDDPDDPDETDDPDDTDDPDETDDPDDRH